MQIEKGISPFCSTPGTRLLVTGGGAKNTFLIEILRQYLGDSIEVVVPDVSIVDYKEALVFALMGGEKDKERGQLFKVGDWCLQGFLFRDHIPALRQCRYYFLTALV